MTLLRNLILGIFCSCLCQGWAIEVIIFQANPAYCGTPVAELQAQVIGGIPPFTYAWSTGATTWNAGDVPIGTYSVTVTDANSDQAYAEHTVVIAPLPNPPSAWETHCPSLNIPLDEGGYLFIRIGWPPDPTPPLTFDGPYSSVSYQNPDLIAQMVAHIIPDGGVWPVGFYEPFQITGTDANGCPFVINTERHPHPEWIDVSVMNVDGACSGGNNGSITLVNTSWSWWSLWEELWLDGQMIGSYPLGMAFENDTRIYSGLEAGTYTLVQRPNWDAQEMGWLEGQFVDPDCRDSMQVVVPDLGYTCGTVSGKVFIDSNHNCQENGGEPGIAFTVVEAQPGGHYALTDAQGNYSMNLPYGTYTLADQSTLYQEHCGVEGTPIDLDAGTPFETVNFADTSLTGMDVKLFMSSGAARPGFQLLYSLTTANLTGVLSGPLTITMDFDPAISFISASPAPTSVSGNTITWNIAQNLGPFQYTGQLVRFQVPPDVGLLGTELISSASVTTGNMDVDPANNNVIHTVTVTGSYDPNDKLASTNSAHNATEFFIDQDEWIDYVIRFQNTGTDTAFNVVITDTLSGLLDMATFQQGTASHPFSVRFKTGRVVEWSFINIQLPDSNVNEPLSHGLVSFRIKPHLPLLPGDQIENIANIYFDFNEPVITDPNVLVATMSTGVEDKGADPGLMLYPNPAQGEIFIRGEDRVIRSVEIFSVDGKLVLRQEAHADGVVIDIRSLQAGAYVVRAMDVNGSLLRTRFNKH